MVWLALSHKVLQDFLNQGEAITVLNLCLDKKLLLYYQLVIYNSY